MIVLDTNVCVAFLNGSDAALAQRFARHEAQLHLTSVVRAELLYGARASATVSANLERLADFFADLKSLPFDDAAAEEYATIRFQLRRAGTPIGPNDLLIAATALAHDATVVTRNEREFVRVPGLRVQRW